MAMFALLTAALWWLGGGTVRESSLIRRQRGLCISVLTRPCVIDHLADEEAGEA